MDLMGSSIIEVGLTSMCSDIEQKMDGEVVIFTQCWWLNEERDNGRMVQYDNMIDISYTGYGGVDG